MILIVAEKPAAGQAIAKVVGADKRKDGYMAGNGYIVSWCIGHLVDLAEPADYDPALKKWSLDTLPIIPASYKTVVLPGTEYQFNILKRLMHRNDVTELIEATDAAREGELIFRLVYSAAGCTKPYRRLWVSSQEDDVIRSGLKNAKPGADYDNMYLAGLCRQQADWLLGINLTRLYTKLYDRRFPVGRVQTPTVSLIVKRQEEIDSFQPEHYFTLVADLDGFLAYARAETDVQTQKIVARCGDADAYVTKVESLQRSEAPPKLYDLADLQKDANRLYGYTAQQTADYLQQLYEAKLSTYPRTDSHFLTSEMAASTAALLDHLLSSCIIPPLMASNYDRQRVTLDQIIDDAKVSDHHAIILTDNLSKDIYDSLPTGEKNIITLILARFLAAPYAPRIYEATKIILDLDGTPFTATGHTDLDLGFKIIAPLLANISASELDEPENELLPRLQEGDTRPVLSVKAYAKKTRPPAAYTDADLLDAMETCGKALANDELRDVMKNCGIGTPATRAIIIESIIKSGYIRRSGKSLVPTDNGLLFMQLVTDKLKDPALTATWEMQLAEIQRGVSSAEEFMAGVKSFVRSFITDVKLLHPDTKQRSTSDLIGCCPLCGKAVREYPKSYSCESGRDGCGFTIWKTIGGRSINRVQAQKLITEGQTDLIKGFTSTKTGRSYAAYLVLTKDKSVGFKFPNRKTK